MSAEATNPFAREDQLTPADRESLVAAIKSAYPAANRDFLYSRLARSLGIHVADDVIALNNPGTTVVRAIVDYARAQGKTLELLGATWTEVSGNPELRTLANRFLPDQTAVLAKFAPSDSMAVAEHPTLERLVAARSRLLDPAAFKAGLERLTGALCKVEAGRSGGTGFLVGRRTVLTNYHVVADALRTGVAGDGLICTFDFADNDLAKVVVTGGAKWDKLSSPYSQSDLTGIGEPGENELDFALITLAHEVEPTRVALPWPTSPPIVAHRDFLVIGQHPRGQSAKIAFGEVVDLPSSGLRYRYDVVTGPGSSGAPVLNLDLELVGLHHAANPESEPRYNQAVPIPRLMALFQSQNLDVSTL